MTRRGPFNSASQRKTLWSDTPLIRRTYCIELALVLRGLQPPGTAHLLVVETLGHVKVGTSSSDRLIYRHTEGP
jgi:hypothetical protein